MDFLGVSQEMVRRGVSLGSLVPIDKKFHWEWF